MGSINQDPLQCPLFNLYIKNFLFGTRTSRAAVFPQVLHRFQFIKGKKVFAFIVWISSDLSLEERTLVCTIK